MSTGLVINKALYGTGSNTVDVTSAVSSKVKDGVLNFTVSPTSLNVDDPAPGQLKQIDIVYTINDGKKNEMMKKDNDLVFIDAPPKRDASGLQIVKAEYGYSGNFTDVTDALQNLMKSDGSIDVKVGFKELGLPDPNPNKQKTLSVEYTINGAPTINNLKDGERFRLNAPAKDTTGGAPSGFNPIGWLFWIGLTVLGSFLSFLSILVSYRVGRDYIIGGTVGGMLFGSLGMIMPIAFPFILLPIGIFFIRLFRSTDIIV